MLLHFTGSSNRQQKKENNKFQRQGRYYFYCPKYNLLSIYRSKTT